MKKLMTKHFSRWVNKQQIPKKELSNSLSEIQAGNFEANLGGNLYKKRIRSKGQGKSGGGRTIICYKKTIEQFSFMVLPKMKNQIYLKKNLLLSKNYQKYC